MASNRIKSNFNFISSVYTRYPEILIYTQKLLKSDKVICSSFLSKKPEVMKYMPLEICQDPDIVLLAIMHEKKSEPVYCLR